MIVQNSQTNVPILENEIEEFEIPEYVKMCAELSVDLVVTEDKMEARVFHIITGSAVFGICIGEVKDSFLVALPCQLVSENGKVDGKPFAKGKVIRLFKTAVAFMTIPEADHLNYYYKWLKRQFTSLPSFFSQVRRDIVEDFVYAYENRSKQSTEQHEDQSDDNRIEDGDTGGSPESFWSPYTSTEFH